MITVEIDYEPIIYEQPFSSHIYENQLKVGPIKNKPQITQEVNEINTVIKPDKKRRSTMLEHKSYLSKHKKKQPREKIWTIPFLLESLRSKEFQPPDLDF